MAALEGAQANAARFVGGCVRDALLSEIPNDIDIATVLRPEQTISALEAAGLKAVPTGVAHGTVTAVAHGVGVEVTTLRSDVSTDGRRATVAFTGDWRADASRRDFTINALYLTADGRLFDPFDGVADLEGSTVRFIGEPTARIAEDYLRILRFFRFSARFADAFDGPGFNACKEKRDGLSILSAERIGMEISKILAHPRAGFALEGMAEAGVLKKVWPHPADLAALVALKKTRPNAHVSSALAALFGAGGEGEGAVAALRLPNAVETARRKILQDADTVANEYGRQDGRAALYKVGPESWADALALAQAQNKLSSHVVIQLERLAENSTPPRFPISGDDILEAGVPSGPKVAETLGALKEAWIDAGFPDRDQTLRLLAALMRAGR